MADFEVTSEGRPMFSLTGELDMATAPLLEVAISGAVDSDRPITLDISGLTFLDTTGVGTVVRAASSLVSGCVTLHGARDGAGRVLTLMGVDRSKKVHVVPCLNGHGSPD